MILPLQSTTFPRQYELLDPWVRMTRRTAIDRTGMGVALQDLLEQTNGGRVMGIAFGGTNDQGVRMKVDLAIGLKRSMEQARFRIPIHQLIRQEFMSIKREATATGVTFDAPRIEIETAVAGGKKRKQYAHADRFWAAALANHAAQSSPLALGLTTSESMPSFSQLRGFV